MKRYMPMFLMLFSSSVFQSMRRRALLAVSLAAFAFMQVSAVADIVWTDMNVILISPLDVKVDITKDGVWDFSIFGSSGTSYLEPLGSNSYAAFSLLDLYSFDRGDVIGSSLEWANTPILLLSEGVLGNEGNFIGNIAEANKYFGLSIEIDGATHYGWIHLSHDSSRASPDDKAIYIHDWAFESDADTPIIAGAIPEPSSVLLLMLGAGGLWMARRKRFR